ncbi:hypothetical protein EV421DRAFT_1793358 [Armillaria borealis]|uniref:Uncharacterized protein n=1 Tax=Armillaria borealis TaxID=47425 RepID=A0AA39MU94_9AGAR|nr:hypothetical protein EV421DRAFT_1793358 [Armillaria borealis]
MSLSKPLTLSRINDLILGSFSALPPSATLDHLVRYLGTWSGSDKLFMVLQYTLQLLVPLLNLRARLQCQAGLRKDPTSSAAVGIAKFAKIINDSRTLWRFWGLLPIFQWLISLERNPQPTRNLLTIERLQGWSMLGYYPLEHLSYLTSRDIIPTTISSPLVPQKAITLKPGPMGVWSCRFWAAYVILQFAHLREDRKLLQARQRTLRRAKGAGITESEKQEIQNRWDSYWNEMVLNLGNLPLALNWSTEKGFIKNQVWVDILCLITALASFRGGWRATALHSPPPPAPTPAEAVIPPTEASADVPTVAYDISG